MVQHFHSGTIDYDIVIERGALRHIGDRIDLDRRIMVVTDSGVPQQYVQSVLSQCPQGSLFTFKAGEASKNISTFTAILQSLLDNGFTRSDAVIAVGGGVTGDTAGFAAACYMRGIDFYNIPTTLLSQVDSSVGGKTAVDFGGVKNPIGAFHHPRAVIIDPDTLRTLDTRLIHEGLVEAIKMAATCDSTLFTLIESAADLNACIDEVIFKAIDIKRRIVQDDPQESGLRRVLNFGHTVGHAIESIREGELLHGECVAIGMMYMSGGEARSRIENLLKRYGLPVTDDTDPSILLSGILHDKKKSGDTVTVVYVDTIGNYSFRKVSTAELAECLKNRKL
ncbi:MAG: 3-dehydroquinate synthase [Bacteroidaceae bacterium]|nr:3-dehydroquinate synthase [Bacteroidaceae bacterium]